MKSREPVDSMGSIYSSIRVWGKVAPTTVAYGGHQNAHDDENKQILIVVEHVAQNPVQDSRAGAAFSHLRS